MRYADCKPDEAVFNAGNFCGAPLCCARAFGRAEGIYLFRFPPLAPQRDTRLGGRAGLLSIVPDWTPDTRALPPGVFILFLGRRGAERSTQLSALSHSHLKIDMVSEAGFVKMY
jgi:hypothetical protein